MTDIGIPEAIDMGQNSSTSIRYIYTEYQEYLDMINNDALPVMDSVSRYACGFPIPDFQREIVWTPEQNIAFIKSAWLGISLGSFTHHDMAWDKNGAPTKFSGWLIDGQQRLTCLEKYWNDEFKVFGMLWSEVERSNRLRFMNTRFPHFCSRLWDERKIRDLYNLLNFGGTPHKQSEMA